MTWVNEHEIACLVVSHYIEEGYDIQPSAEVLQNLDLSLDLFLLDRFEDFDDTFLVIDDVDAFKDFGVFASTCPRSAPRPRSIESVSHLSCARLHSSPGRPMKY